MATASRSSSSWASALPSICGIASRLCSRRSTVSSSSTIAAWAAATFLRALQHRRHGGRCNGRARCRRSAPAGAPAGSLHGRNDRAGNGAPLSGPFSRSPARVHRLRSPLPRRVAQLAAFARLLALASAQGRSPASGLSSACSIQKPPQWRESKKTSGCAPPASRPYASF